jgi:hypothetical protein
MRIVSRLNQDETQLERLREILEAASHGAISEYGVELPGETLQELVTQVDETCCNFLVEVDNLEENYVALQHEALSLSVQTAAQEKIIDSLTNGIQFDEALEHATITLMDSFLGSGAADSTFDGGLSFESGVIFTKEDLKPMLRQALDSWITMKIK